MDATEQYLLALELIVSLRLAMDPPHVLERLEEAVQAGMLDSSPVEQEIRARALRVIQGCQSC